MTLRLFGKKCLPPSRQSRTSDWHISLRLSRTKKHHFASAPFPCFSAKALLGAEENRNLLIHFLNAFLAQELAGPIVWVEIQNPYNEKEFLTDKLSIVDVKAKDSQGQLYQIEIQLTSYGHLPARIIYNWTDLYSQRSKVAKAMVS